jgi:hypothetical protein
MSSDGKETLSASWTPPLFMNRELGDGRDLLKVYNQPESTKDMSSSTSNVNFRLSFLGVTLSTSSMPSKLFTAHRVTHSEITESDAF